jgi:predicted nucleic acid-binding protein
VTPGKWPDRFVVDASVALKFAWHEPPHSDAASRFFAAADKKWTQLMAPSFWLTECANGCWKRVKRQFNTREEAATSYAVICALPVVRIETTDLADTVLGIALQNHLTAYDALYIATAQFADVPLVTADTRLMQALSDAHWSGRALHISQW